MQLSDDKIWETIWIFLSFYMSLQFVRENHNWFLFHCIWNLIFRIGPDGWNHAYSGCRNVWRNRLFMYRYFYIPCYKKPLEFDPWISSPTCSGCVLCCLSTEHRPVKKSFSFLNIGSVIKSTKNYHRLTMRHLLLFVRYAVDEGREEKALFILSILEVGYLLTPLPLFLVE